MGVKLLLNVVMSVVLLLVLLNPVRDLSIGRGPLTELSTIFFLSAVVVGMVSLISLISVFKPWGRIRAGQDPARHRGDRQPWKDLLTGG